MTYEVTIGKNSNQIFWKDFSVSLSTKKKQYMDWVIKKLEKKQFALVERMRKLL